MSGVSFPWCVCVCVSQVGNKILSVVTDTHATHRWGYRLNKLRWCVFKNKQISLWVKTQRQVHLQVNMEDEHNDLRPRFQVNSANWEPSLLTSTHIVETQTELLSHQVELFTLKSSLIISAICPHTLLYKYNNNGGNPLKKITYCAFCHHNMGGLPRKYSFLVSNLLRVKYLFQILNTSHFKVLCQTHKTHYKTTQVLNFTAPNCS